MTKTMNPRYCSNCQHFQPCNMPGYDGLCLISADYVQEDWYCDCYQELQNE